MFYCTYCKDHAIFNFLGTGAKRLQKIKKNAYRGFFARNRWVIKMPQSEKKCAVWEKNACKVLYHTNKYIGMGFKKL
jgi:hypothetical protein